MYYNNFYYIIISCFTGSQDPLLHVITAWCPVLIIIHYGPTQVGDGQNICAPKPGRSTKSIDWELATKLGIGGAAGPECQTYSQAQQKGPRLRCIFSFLIHSAMLIQCCAQDSQSGSSTPALETKCCRKSTPAKTHLMRRSSDAPSNIISFVCKIQPILVLALISPVTAFGGTAQNLDQSPNPLNLIWWYATTWAVLANFTTIRAISTSGAIISQWENFAKVMRMHCCAAKYHHTLHPRSSLLFQPNVYPIVNFVLVRKQAVFGVEEVATSIHSRHSSSRSGLILTKVRCFWSVAQNAIDVWQVIHRRF